MHDFYKKFGPHLLDDYQRVRSESHDTEALLYEEAKYIMERGKWMVMTSSSCGRPLFHFLSDTKMKAYLSQVGYQIMYGCSAFIDALEGEAHDVFFRSGRGLIQIPPCFVPAYIVDESLQPNFIRVLPYHIEGKTKSGLIIPLGRRTREQHAWYFHIPFCSIDTATEKYQSICRDVNATPSDGLHDDRCYLRIREAGNTNTTFTYIPPGHLSVCTSLLSTHSIPVAPPGFTFAHPLVPNKFQQKQHAFTCCICAISVALYASGLKTYAHKVYRIGIKQEVDVTLIDKLHSLLVRLLQPSHKVKKHQAFDPLVSPYRNFPVLAKIKGQPHAIAFYKELIFEPSLPFALELSHANLEFICGGRFPGLEWGRVVVPHQMRYKY